MVTDGIKSSEGQYLSVSEFAQLLNTTLEQNVGTVPFEGEIAELTRAASGHLYGCLKDQASQLSFVLWAQTVRSLNFNPAQGMQVRCLGRPNVYAKNGRLQIVVQRMQPAGEGLLRKKFLELKSRLEREGLFAPERKRPVPFIPRGIGIVTSAVGAAIQDIMVRLRDRMPHIPVYLVDVRVQGPGAAEDIARGIEQLNESGLVDVLIVGRGGGSLEDLWSFNEEVLVRAVFASRLPVISAVGHEKDFSLCDFAADVRAPTPTAAAEIVVPRAADLLARVQEFQTRLFDFPRWLGPFGQQLDDLATRIERGIVTVVKERQLRLITADAHLKALEPGKIFESWRERLGALDRRLTGALRQSVQAAAMTVERLQGRLRQALPPQRLALHFQRIAIADGTLRASVARLLAARTLSIENLITKLEAINPSRVLERGYAMVQSAGRPVTRAARLKANDSLTISFTDGKVGARVTEDPILVGGFDN